MEHDDDEDEHSEGEDPQPGSKRSRPDRAAKLKDLQSKQVCAIKMTLNQLCNNAELIDEIEICVHGVTRTSIEASRFLNFYILTLLEQNQPVPKLDQSLFYGAFTTMAGANLRKTVEKFGPALQDYRELRPLNMAKFDCKNVTQMLNYAGKEYMTACMNHVVLNISGRVGKAFKLYFQSLPQQFKAADRNKARRYFMRRMTREGNAEDEDPMWLSFNIAPTLETRAAIATYVQVNLERYSDLPLDTGGPHPIERVKHRWWAYLPWLYALQGFMQQNNSRAFSILPLCSFASKHITVDTGILHGLLTRVAARTGGAKPDILTQFRAHARQHWEAHFRLTKAEGKNIRRNFYYIIKTDGLAVSAVLTKPKEVDTPIPERNVSILSKRVIGVDPGRKDLVTCTWMHDGNQQSSKYSNKEYQQKIGLKKAGTKRKEWMKEAALYEAMTQLPSAKTPSTVAMRTHIVALFGILDRVLELNGKRRVRSLKFSQHCLRQRVMYDICKRITDGCEGDKRSPVVAFGAGMFSSCSKGHAPGPVKEVRRALRRRGVAVYDVQEDYTSQLCNGCKEKLVPMYSEGGGYAIHGVRRCLSATCMRNTWNRDINASLNILYIFIEETLHRSRPERFTRTYQAEQARQAGLRGE